MLNSSGSAQKAQKTVFDTKSFFKPLNIRIKSIQANKL